MGRDSVAWADLRAAIRRIERRGTAFGKTVVTTGDAAFDGHFSDGGLARAACHEIAGDAAAGFAAGLAGRALTAGGYLFWCQSDAGFQRHGGLYGPGLASFDITAERCLHVRARNEQDLLWSIEEIARSPAAACIVAEVASLDLSSSRRLQLAVEAGGGILLLLRRGRRNPAPVATATRFDVQPVAMNHETVWQTMLWRAKGSAPGSWRLIWQPSDKGGRFQSLHDQGRQNLHHDRQFERIASN